MVHSDRAQCPTCGVDVRPASVVETVSKVGLIVDKGHMWRATYRHCGQEWTRSVHLPPRWSSPGSPGQGP